MLDSNVISRDSNGTDKSIEIEEDKIEIEEYKEKEQKENTQPFEQYTGKENIPKNKFSELTNYWNEKVPQQKTPFTAMNMSLSGDIITLLDNTDTETIKTAIDHYGLAYEHNKYRVAGFTNFMTIKNVETWFPESSVENRKPTEEKEKEDEPVYKPGSIKWN